MTPRRARILLVVLLIAGCRGVLEVEVKDLVGAPNPADDAGDGSAADAARSDVDASADADCDGCAPTCDGGPCPPRVVTELGTLVYGLAESGDYVYWTTDGAGSHVKRAPKRGGPPENMADTGGAPSGIVVKDGFLYWATQFSGTISRMSVFGGRVDTLASGQTKAAYLAIDEDSIYFTRYAAAGDVRSIPRDGGAASIVVPSSMEPLGVAADDQFLYYTLNSGPDIGFWRADKTGAGRTRYTDAEAPLTIPVDDAGAFTAGPSAIVRVDKVTGVATNIVEGVSARRLAADEVAVYWTSPSGVVAKAPKTGGAPTPIATGQGSADFIVVDATTVYWLSGTRLYATSK